MIYDFVSLDSEYAKILSTLKSERYTQNKHHIFVSGLCTGASDALLCSLTEQMNRETNAPGVILCGNEKECARVSAFLSEHGFIFPYYRARDFVFTNISASLSDECERLRILYSLTGGKCHGVVTTPSAFLQYTVPKDILSENILTLEVGERCDPSVLIQKLLFMGYARTDLVDSQGQFSARGDIVDVFVPFLDEEAGGAVRIEFFGDDIDRIGFFDINTQRVGENAQKVQIFPAREVMYSDADIESIKKSIVNLQKKEKTT